MNRPPLAVLKLPLTMLLTAFLLSAIGTLWSWHQKQDALHTLQQQASELEDARKKLETSRHQQQLVAAHLADYQALVARGFAGPEDRLAWIDAIQHANRDAALYGLTYRLTPRAAAPAELAQGLPLGQTTMTLAMPLLVETDLPRYLAALKARAPGVVRVQGCRLSRPEAAPFVAVNKPQLQAECGLHWYTLGEKNGSKP